MSKALIPLDVIASGICLSLGDSQQKHKFEIMIHLIDCYRHYSLFLGQEKNIKTVVLDTDHSIVMGNDFIRETKVGVCRNGRIAMLTLDNNTHCKMGDGEVSDYLNSVWDGSYEGDGYWFYNYRSPGGLGELYGLGRSVSNPGTYSIDRKQGVIHIGSHIPLDSEIVVEYESSGVEDGLCLVPAEIKKMMEYYAKSEWYADKNITQSQINRNYYEREYNINKRLYNLRTSLFIAAEVNSFISPTNY